MQNKCFAQIRHRRRRIRQRFLHGNVELALHSAVRCLIAGYVQRAEVPNQTVASVANSIPRKHIKAIRVVYDSFKVHL